MGNAIYKEFTVNGKTEGHWVEIIEESEFDSNGNEIHSKGSYGYEKWTEYDSNGNVIHSKDARGFEYFYEYTYSEDNKIIKKIFYEKIIKED